jgi:L-fucose mutarotase
MVLASMGHGDEIVVVDVNFPAQSTAGDAPVIELAGVTSPEAVDLILQLMPLDSFVDAPVLRMEYVGDPERLEPVQVEAQAALDAREPGYRLKGVERFEFYDRAAKAFAIVRSGERRFYGCFILKKGVLGPDGKGYHAK